MNTHGAKFWNGYIWVCMVCGQELGDMIGSNVNITDTLCSRKVTDAKENTIPISVTN